MNFPCTGRRAINASTEVIKITDTGIKELLTQAADIRFKLYAVNAPYDIKELLKSEDYRWVMNQNDKYRADLLN